MKKLIVLIFLSTTATSLLGQTKHHSADYYFHRGAIYLVMPGEKSDSLAKVSMGWYTRAIKADHRYWRAYRNRASLYEYLNLHQSAIHDLTLAIQYCTTAERLSLYGKRGEIYYKIDLFDEAASDYTQAIAFGANLDYWYLQRAKANWKLGLKQIACKDYTIATKHNPALVADKEFLGCD